MATKDKFFKNRIGEILESNNYGKFEIVEFIDSKNIIVKFINTGTISKSSSANILAGRLKDPSIHKLVFGWGINDADYEVQSTVKVDGKYKRVYVCPIYSDWSNILERGCCPKLKSKYPTYKDVKVCEEWKYFSNFRNWVLNIQPNKDWMRCEPDKDLLCKNSEKIYSPDTVVYISRSLNLFLSGNAKGKYLTGANKTCGTNFNAKVNNPFTGKSEYLGTFPNELSAHLAWKTKKHEYACQLADLQDDPRVANALRNYFVE